MKKTLNLFYPDINFRKLFSLYFPYDNLLYPRALILPENLPVVMRCDLLLPHMHTENGFIINRELESLVK